MTAVFGNQSFQIAENKNKGNFVVFVMSISIALQYNFLFSAEYLWLSYWSGADIRTSISFISILLCIIVLSLNINLRSVPWKFIGVLMFYAIYGIIIGLVNNEPSIPMAAEPIFWIEIVLYIFIFSSVTQEKLAALIRIIIYYSAINAILSIVYFWMIRDQIAVAALVGDQRIVRVADLLAPLLILLFIIQNVANVNKKLSVIWTVPVILLVLLGFFRSVWAAFILAYILSNLFFITSRSFIRIASMALLSLIFILGFEYIFSYFFEVDNVILGRIMAGVGTEDSLGRISSAGEVLEQMFDEPSSVIFGAGFGKYVGFVNDFGYGPIYAMQPLATLSNYYVVFVFEVGIFIAFFYALYIARSVRWIIKSFDEKVAKALLLTLFYMMAQWLTFPTTIHYPIAMMVGLYFALASFALPGKATDHPFARNYAVSRPS